MTTQVPNDFNDFSKFVGEYLSGRSDDLSLEESVAAFRIFQHELGQLKRAIQPAIDELNRGEGTTLDVEAIISRGKRQLAAEGIID